MHEPQMCRLRELQDGTHSIDDLADMHEAMDVMAEIRDRISKVDPK